MFLQKFLVSAPLACLLFVANLQFCSAEDDTESAYLKQVNAVNGNAGRIAPATDPTGSDDIDELRTTVRPSFKPFEKVKEPRSIELDAAQQSAAIAIPATLKPDHKKEKPGGFFKPVSQLHDELITLEHILTNLTSDIDVLPPSMLRLVRQISGTQQQAADLQAQAALLHEGIGSSSTRLSQVESGLAGLRLDLATLKQPMADLTVPITQLRDPILQIQQPLLAVKFGLSDVDTRLTRLDVNLKTLDARFAGLDRRFASLDARFAELNTRFVGLDTWFAVLSKQLESLASLLNLIVITILVTAVVMIPVGALATLRHRAKRNVRLPGKKRGKSRLWTESLSDGTSKTSVLSRP